MLCLAVLGCGCTSDPAESVSVVRQPVLSSELGRYFDYAFVPAPSFEAWAERFPAASLEERLSTWRTELLELGAVNQAAGSVTGAALDASGATLFVEDAPNIPLRYSCGATLISPSLVLTAAHCVASDTGPVTLQMYRPTARLVEAVGNGLAISGTWPDFAQDALLSTDGYLIDEYPCEHLVRCDTDWGPTINCPFDGYAQDVAILRCDGAPGFTYGYARLASPPAVGTEVFVPWKHEVFDFAASSADPAELDQHYVQKGTVQSNYHYFGDGRHQLLPLRSRPWEDGTPRTVTEAEWTDLMGCHGISGSGIFSRSADEFRVWGVMTSGSSDLTDLLCQGTDERLASGDGPGSSFLGSNWTQVETLLEWIAGDFAGDCASSLDVVRATTGAGSPLDGSSHRVATWFSNLDCQAISTSVPATAPGFALEAQGGDAIELASNQTVTLSGFGVTSEEPHRLGVHVVRQSSCVDDCTRGALVATQAPTSSFAFGGEAGLVASVGVSFIPSEPGQLSLSVENQGEPTQFVGATVLREGQANAFDTPFDRMATSLFAITAQGPVGPVPARFTGDGVAGFSALMLDSERLLFTRQALLPGRRWTVRVEATDPSVLSCGFVDGLGTVLVSTPCRRVFQLDQSDVTVTPSAFFVETSAASGRVEIQAVALASDVAADEDSDGIADVLDGCVGVVDPERDRPCSDVDAGAGGAPALAEDAGVPGITMDAGLTAPEGGAGGGGAGGGDAGAGSAAAPNGGGGVTTTSPDDAGAGTDPSTTPSVPPTSAPEPSGDAAPGVAGAPPAPIGGNTAAPSAADAGTSRPAPSGSCACTATRTRGGGALATFGLGGLLLLAWRRRSSAHHFSSSANTSCACSAGETPRQILRTTPVASMRTVSRAARP